MAPWTPSKIQRLPHPKGEAAVRGTTLVAGSVAPGNSSSRSRANPADLRRRSLFDLNPRHGGDLRTTCCRGTLHPVGPLRSGSYRPTPPRPCLCPHYASRAARCQGDVLVQYIPYTLLLSSSVLLTEFERCQVVQVLVGPDGVVDPGPHLEL